MASPINSTDLRIVPGDPEPRFLDLRLAERLEFDRPRDIRKLIERNKPELERQGILRHHGAYSGERGRPGTEYWLTFKQGMIICMKSDARRAPDIRSELAELSEAWFHGKLVPVNNDIIPTIAGTFRDLFEDIVIPAIKGLETRLDAKIKAVAGNVTILATKGRKDPNAETERIHGILCRHHYFFMCGCEENCGTVIMDKNGFIKGTYEYHHQFNRNDARTEATIPLATACHKRITTNAEAKTKFDMRAWPQWLDLLSRLPDAQGEFKLKMPGEE